jgi:hypothetical protein
MLALKIPPGLYKNGTEFQSAGRWLDSNLVRWVDDTMRPVGGWRVKSTTAMTGKIRSMITWTDNSSNRRIATASFSKLYSINEAGVKYDITPTSFTSGREDATLAIGYGQQTYGSSGYGIERPDNGTYLPATTWSLDMWGEYLIANSPDDGKLYEWQLGSSTPAAVITNAPTSCRAAVVTHERFLMALGAGGNGRSVKWSDQEDNTTWTAAATNQAGDFELTTEGRIVGGVRVKGQVLILTDIDAHTATYQGPPFVYGFDKIGSHCGLVAAKSLVGVDTFAVWMSNRSFYIYDGYAKPLDSDVSDYVFNNLNPSQISKVSATVNSKFNEIWWFYPSATSTECDSYVTWNYKENHWAVGEIDRTAGVDAGIFRFPMFASTNGKIYEHEVGFDYDSATPFAESGPIPLGSSVMSVTGMVPDEKTLGDVQAKFKTRFHPTDTEREYGPFTMANPTSLRFTGRQVKMRIESSRSADWRVGVMQLGVQPRGGR